MEEYIRNVIAPKLQGDGGWIEMVSYDGDSVLVRFQGECSKCNVLQKCLKWIESEIKRDLKIEVQLKSVLKKPYFEDSVVK